MARSRSLQLVSALVVLAAATGCGSSTAPASPAADDEAALPSVAVTTEAPETAATEQPTATQPEPTEPADEPVVAQELQFTSSTVDGAAFDGADLAGKDTVLWFWAPWCVVCRGEAPHVAAVQAANADDVGFLGVAALGELDEMQGFVSDYEVGEFAHLADVDGAIWQRFGVTHQPAYAFIDDSGSVEVVRGALGEEGLAELVAGLRAA